MVSIRFIILANSCKQSSDLFSELQLSIYGYGIHTYHTPPFIFRLPSSAPFPSPESFLKLLKLLSLCGRHHICPISMIYAGVSDSGVLSGIGDIHYGISHWLLDGAVRSTMRVMWTSSPLRQEGFRAILTNRYIVWRSLLRVLHLRRFKEIC